MSGVDARYRVKKLVRQHVALKVAEALLWSLAIFILLYTLLRLLNVADANQILVAASGALLSAVFLGYKISLISEARIINFINHHYTLLEESADLLVQEDHTLNSLQRLQKSKTIEQFEVAYKSIRLPQRLGQATGLLLVSLLLFMVVSSFIVTPTPKREMGYARDSTKIKKQRLPASLERATITITPPAYTLRLPYTVSDFNLTIPEGSFVTWSLAFSDTIVQAQIVLPTDTLALRKKNANVEISRSFNKSSIYQFRWITTNGLEKTSDYYSIKVTSDAPPSIQAQGLAPFTALKHSDRLSIGLTASLEDDYSLTDAYIIATVSKGSGESVKFREEQLRFSQPQKISGKDVKANRIIDLITLGLEPGDELYFYIEALDNKVPAPNRARTETYFISIQDTASENFTTDAGLGVDLLPDYFRSQRQIIIDTENLLRDKKVLTKQTFNTTSNEVGYDQKVLRLKYGQFLGEEFESGIGPQPETPDEENPEEEDVTKKFGHVHDTENEHNLVEEKKEKDNHHKHGDEESENSLEGFIHEHDNAEEATFFIQSIKLKLKAALTLMWDAELYLRLYEPAKSLPYQYQTLKLLKEISNDSRIYVHRTGFDPPPVKEDKRLTGEMTDVKSTKTQSTTETQPDFPEIRRALTVVEHACTQKEIKLSPTERAILRKAGNELAPLALEHPGKYLTTLSLLNTLLEDEIKQEKMKLAFREIRKIFWEVLPVKPSSPYAPETSNHPLNQQFMKHLNEQNHE